MNFSEFLRTGNWRRTGVLTEVLATEDGERRRDPGEQDVARMLVGEYRMIDDLQDDDVVKTFKLLC